MWPRRSKIEFHYKCLNTIVAHCRLVSSFYYMASSASGQDDPNRALWLATRAGKMEPSCPLGTSRCIPQAKFPRKPYNKSFIDQLCSVKMAGYWPRSYFASLWPSTSSRSINTQKKTLANIQPSWPHTWSITHTYGTRAMLVLNLPTIENKNTQLMIISMKMVRMAKSRPRKNQSERSDLPQDYLAT